MATHFAPMELVLIAIALSGLAPAHGMEPTPAHEATAQLVSDAKSEYLRKLAAYQAARQAFEDLSAPYWDEVRQKRQSRSTKRRNGEAIVAQDYVLTQPPLYGGPPRPVPPPDVREELPRPPALPVVADFLRHAHEQYRFAPTRPASEIDFKQAYAKSPVRPDLRESRRFGSTPSRSAATANTIPRPVSKRIGRDPARSRPRSATINC